jgi:hypothetical protein
MSHDIAEPTLTWGANDPPLTPERRPRLSKLAITLLVIAGLLVVGVGVKLAQDHYSRRQAAQALAQAAREGAQATYIGPASKYVSAVVVGPGGNVYLLSGSTRAITMILPSGVRRTFHVPNVVAAGETRNAPLVGLAVTSDGTMYSTDLWHQSVVRITPDGRTNIDWLKAPTDGLTSDLIASTDDTLYALGTHGASGTGNRLSISRITTAGALTRNWVQLGPIKPGVAAINAGPKGSVYVTYAPKTAPSRYLIDAVSADGTITSKWSIVPEMIAHAVGELGAQPQNMTIDSAGHPWLVYDTGYGPTLITLNRGDATTYDAWQVVTPQGRLLALWTIAKAPDGTLYGTGRDGELFTVTLPSQRRN